MSAVELPSLLALAAREALSRARRVGTPCGDGELVWHVWGENGPGTPVVLLHGGSGSWTHWVHNILPLVAAGRPVWAPDLPGFGESAAPRAGRDADALVEPLSRGLHRLLPGRAVDLVGFSFGGLTAGLLLAEHPKLARRLVLVGAPAMGVLSQPRFVLRGWRHLDDAQAQAEVHRHNLGVLMLHDHALIDGLALEIHIGNVLRDRMPRRRLSHTDALARALAQVACPVHAIYGEHDALYLGCMKELADAYTRAAPTLQGLTLIPGAGHWVQFEAPEAFNAELARVLDRAA